MDAAIAAAGAGDQSAIPDLIDMLDSDDALVRMVAILSLERLTGEVRGYDHAAPEWQRSAAAEQWAQWARSNSQSNSQSNDQSHTQSSDLSSTPSNIQTNTRTEPVR